MPGGFIAFRCSNYDTTAEREQFRLLCKKMRSKYSKSEDFYLLIGNYNIFDSELDAIVIKHDSIIAIEFKNYGGNIVAKENGDWTANGVAIKGGSRKTVYQQARINHAALRNGLKDLGINNDWLKDIPTLVVFNQTISLENQLSPKVQSWLHITDNAHFLDKIEDITSNTTNLSNVDIIDLAIQLNLNPFILTDLSSYTIEQKTDSDSKNEGKEPNPTSESLVTDIRTDNKEEHVNVLNDSNFDKVNSYDRFCPNHIFALRPNQIFVFGTDRKGSQRYGAAGTANKKFGAQVGVVEGPTGYCYALPTKGFEFSYFTLAVKRFKEYVDAHSENIFLITPVGCGHAGFNINEVASLFADLVNYENVMLPKMFIDEYISMGKYKSPSDETHNDENVQANPMIKALKIKLSQDGKEYNRTGSFTLSDNNGNVIAEAELGIEKDKIVFSPFNVQSEIVFRNHGYSIFTPEEYLENK